MGDFSKLIYLSEEFLSKDKLKKINSIKSKEEKKELLENSLISELRLKHLDLEVKIKKIKEKKKKHILTLKSNIIPSKINLLRADFNEKDFKKIDSLIFKLTKEVEDV